MESGSAAVQPLEVGAETERPTVVRSDDLETPEAALHAPVEYGDLGASLCHLAAVDQHSHAREPSDTEWARGEASSLAA